MHLCKKVIFFLNVLLHLWNQHDILNILKKEDKRYNVCISEILGCEKHGYWNA